MKRRIRRTYQKKSTLLGAVLVGLFGGAVQAMPQDGSVQSGAANITENGKNMVIDQKTDRLAIDWKSFDIARDEAVRFNQPGLDSIALNRITGGFASHIDGSLFANGNIFLVNPNGVLFGHGARVDVGGLVASTAELTNAQMADFANGKSPFSLALGASTAPIINEGEIRAQGGLVALHAATVENKGTITNEGGKIALAAAKEIDLSADEANKINFRVDGKLANAKVLNTGALSADSGYVLMTAKAAGDAMSSVVNNEGVVEANTAREGAEGQIVLESDGTTVAGGMLSAEGKAAGTSGGSIQVNGADTTVADGATLTADGQVNGGSIDTSGDVVHFGDFSLSAKGKTGKAGSWTIDPLEVVISDKQPTGFDPASTSAATALSNNSNDDKKTWVNTTKLETLLNAGTSVTVTAQDKNKVAAITVEPKSDNTGNAIEKTAGGDATLTLEAQRNIVINGDIKSRAGKLGLTLHSDTDGDEVGAVILDGNISTNGGAVNIGSGKNLTDGSTGLYVGHNPLTHDTDAATSNRSITTKGGDVNIYGKTAVALAGKTFSIDTTGGTGVGNVRVHGTVDSGNAYHTYVYSETDSAAAMSGEYLDLVKKLMSDKKAFDALLLKFPSTLFDDFKRDSHGNITLGLANVIKYFGFTKNADGTYNVTPEDVKAALVQYGYIYTGADRASLTDGIDWSDPSYNTDATARAKVEALWQKYRVGAADGDDAGRLRWIHKFADAILANDKDGSLATKLMGRSFALWFQGSEALATSGSGSEVGDTYLATITSALENSVVSQGRSMPTFVGGQGSARFDTTGDTVASPADASRTNGFYWTSGPEAASANSSLGQRFTDAAGNAFAGYYTKWGDQSVSNTAQPDGSGSYLTIGYGYDSKWDDVYNLAGTTMGFTQEKNLAASTLKINASGIVNMDGTVGRSRALDGVDITGSSVTVHGITADGTVRLASTGHDGSITLASKTDDDGTITTKSTANNAVIIDEQGSDGHFYNQTTGTAGITTGTGGSWKIYSASPDRNEFGTNLNSHTNAQWHASSTGDTTNSAGTRNTDAIDTYDTAKSGNKYIFQVQPVIKAVTEASEKTYGDVKDSSEINNKVDTSVATFKAKDGTTKTVSETPYTKAFQEDANGKTNKDYVDSNNIDGSGRVYVKDSSGKDITYSSKGLPATATRTGGDAGKTAADGKNAVYKVTADDTTDAKVKTTNGYKVDITDSELTINKRKVTVDTTGKTTYGDGNITNEHKVGGGGFVNGDEGNITYNDTVIPGGGYDKAKEVAKKTYKDNGGDPDKVKTPDAGTYGGSVKTTITNNPGTGRDINDDYDITINNNGGGNVVVDKAELKVNMGDTEATYGGDFSPYSPSEYTVQDNAVNGDSFDKIKKDIKKNGDITAVNGGKGDASKGQKTKDAGTYDVTGRKGGDLAKNDLKNYKITIENGTSTVKKAQIVIPSISVDPKDLANPMDPTKPYIVDGNGKTPVDGNNIYKTVYGRDDMPNKTVTIHGINGDGDINVLYTTDALTGNTTGRITNNVGGDYDTTVGLVDKDGNDYSGKYEFVVDGKSTSTRTFKKTGEVTKADLTIRTNDVRTRYGVPFYKGSYDYTINGNTVVNGDDISSLKKAYGKLADYDNGGIGENGNPTKDPGLYGITGIAGGDNNLSNYNVTIESGISTVEVARPETNKTGTGDDTPTIPNQADNPNNSASPVDPMIPVAPGKDRPQDSELIPSDNSPLTPDITPEKKSPMAYIEQKVEQRAKNPNNVGGTGSISDVQKGAADEFGKILGLMDAQLPFFKVINKDVLNYGTYDVAADPDKVELRPTAKLIPEPNQPKTQYREYVKTITTSTGTGEYRLVYDGSRFLINPVDAAARMAVLSGDATHNVELFSQALLAGFNEMGLILPNIDAAYVFFQ